MYYYFFGDNLLELEIDIKMIIYIYDIKLYSSCKDSIYNDPKLVLGSYVKSPNNKICITWAERLGLGHRTVVSRGAHSSLREGELSVSNKTFPPAQPERLQSLDLVRGVSCSYYSPF